MKSLEEQSGLEEISNLEMREIDGGILPILGGIGAVAGVIYLAGEIAYEIGRRHGNCNSK